MIICAECDGEMFVGDEESKPVMLITGDIENESQRLAICKVCGHRHILKD